MISDQHIYIYSAAYSPEISAERLWGEFKTKENPILRISGQFQSLTSQVSLISIPFSFFSLLWCISTRENERRKSYRLRYCIVYLLYIVLYVYLLYIVSSIWAFIQDLLMYMEPSLQHRREYCEQVNWNKYYGLGKKMK